jgi:hypothetical protein
MKVGFHEILKPKILVLSLIVRAVVFDEESIKAIIGQNHISEVLAWKLTINKCS